MRLSRGRLTRGNPGVDGNVAYGAGFPLGASLGGNDDARASVCRHLRERASARRESSPEPPRRRMRAFLLGALAAGALTLSSAVGSARADTIHIATPQGAREAIVLPGRTTPGPAVIVLHGATATAGWTAQGSGFAEAAAARGFAAVFPQGIRRQWNDGREGRTSAVADVDDVGFLQQLIDEIIGRGIADASRIYIAGISNGGMMTFRMLCEASERFAGAATVIANMPAGVGERCRLRKPVPIVMFNGTADPMVPYDGGGVGLAGGRGMVWGAEQTAAFMARGNGCGDARETTPPAEPPGEPVRVTRLAWSHCRSGSGVILYRLEGAGHQLPGRRQILPGFLGEGTRQVDAADVTLRLFAQRDASSRPEHHSNGARFRP